MLACADDVIEWMAECQLVPTHDIGSPLKGKAPKPPLRGPTDRRSTSALPAYGSDIGSAGAAVKRAVSHLRGLSGDQLPKTLYFGG